MKNITVYSTSSCSSCKMVYRFLDMKKATYEVVNLDEHPERREEAIKISGAMTVPVTTDGKTVIVGWRPELLGAMI